MATMAAPALPVRRRTALTDPLSLLIIALAFLAGGAVKGLAGLGMPVITVAVLTFAFGLPNAMALMVAPGLVTNAWQALGGGQLAAATHRVAHFMVPSFFTIWFGTGLLVTLEANWLVILLGAILFLYAIAGISGASLDVPPRRQVWLGPLFGLVNGITTGMTGVTSTPSVIYVNGLGMPRDLFVQALGVIFFLSYVVLSAALWARGVVDSGNGTLSIVACIPALAGMALGQALRKRTSEVTFKRIFYRVLLAIGLYLIVRGFTA